MHVAVVRLVVDSERLSGHISAGLTRLSSR